MELQYDYFKWHKGEPVDHRYAITLTEVKLRLKNHPFPRTSLRALRKTGKYDLYDIVLYAELKPPPLATEIAEKLDTLLAGVDTDAQRVVLIEHVAKDWCLHCGTYLYGGTCACDGSK